jgi:hypothetical protein
MTTQFLLRKDTLSTYAYVLIWKHTGKCSGLIYCILIVFGSSFKRPACFSQEIKIYGGKNNINSVFAECLKGLNNVVDFINFRRLQPGYVQLNDEMIDSIRASTPLLTELDRAYFGAEDCEIPTNLPCYLAMRSEVAKKKARYTTDNNVLTTERHLNDDG